MHSSTIEQARELAEQLIFTIEEVNNIINVTESFGSVLDDEDNTSFPFDTPEEAVAFLRGVGYMAEQMG